MFTTVQEREHWDYEAGAASELQNTYHRSCMEREPDDRRRIEEWRAKGLYVLVCYAAEYCPSTDASMGERLSFVSASKSRELVEARLAKTGWEDDGDGDYGYYIASPTN